MEAVELIRRVFLRVVTKMSNLFLEKRINMKFWAELGNKADGDQKWCLQYEPDRQAGRQTTSQRTNKVRISKSQMEVMLITCFDIKGIIHFKCIP
jgi:hypothetical protein